MGVWQKFSSGRVRSQAGDFLSAADSGDQAKIIALLRRDRTLVSSKGFEGGTALHFAAFHGHKEIVALLIAHDAEVNEKNDKGKTSLHLSVYAGQELVALLLKNGADVNARDNRGNTPLHEVSIDGDKPEVAELLLAHNAKFNELNDRGRTPLEVAREYEHAMAVANFLDQYRKKQTHAVLESRTRAISPSRNIKGAEAETIFEHGSLDTVKQFLDGLPDINEVLVESSGYAALHLAVGLGDIEKIRIVLRRKPNLELRSRNMLDTPIHTAVTSGHAGHIEVLLDAGAKIEVTSHDELTPLHYAAMRGNVDAVKILLRRGANARATEANGATALHAAAFYGHAEVVRVLMEGGADPNAKDRHSLTPLLLAKQKGHSEALALMSNKPRGKGGVYTAR